MAEEGPAARKGTSTPAGDGIHWAINSPARQRKGGSSADVCALAVRGHGDAGEAVRDLKAACRRREQVAKQSRRKPKRDERDREADGQQTQELHAGSSFLQL